MQHTHSTITSTSPLRRRSVRFAVGALAAATAIGAFGTAAHADGTGDQTELDLWVARFDGTTEADFNADGLVDAADFEVWQSHSDDHAGWIAIESASLSTNR